MSLSPVVQALVGVFAERGHTSRESGRFAVSRTVSALATIYEKARNAVEFRADHLVRRASIERIIKRRLMFDTVTASLAENLVTELLWARYIDSSLINDEKLHELQKIIDRYIAVRPHIESTSGLKWDTLVGLLSSEIEESLVPAHKREALNDFVYQAIRPTIRMDHFDERLVNMITYIAVERAFAHADDQIITYHLLKNVLPEWFDPKTNHNIEVKTFVETTQLIRGALKHPNGDELFRFVRRQMPPYFLLRDFFSETNGEAETIIADEHKFEQKLAEIATKRYQETGKKVRTAVVRSFIYIFLTKMVFAMALELPMDLFITKKIDYLPLSINMFFPPLFMALIAGFITVPGADNTRRLIDRIFTIVYHFDDLKNEKNIFTAVSLNTRPILTAIFTIIYLVTFVLSFGLIMFILGKLHFNISSQIIFVFFVTLVSFFAYRIKQSAKEYEMVDRQGFLGPVFDLFFLPVLRAGHLLSSEIAKINVFIFLFDFILEAPLKVIFEVAEEWIRFIRAKKEEII